ncbi:unnamed protein product [Nippostrongylus brasiliensis]|uniref:C2H2-type domain-containing protein n=1 Tax=Nippostrongylus brasiliensis TaxID=27835 RepID=A0A3P7BL88_NIPBR|nr:unnamed protein product [Nippostrongylus brasiliensis]
MLVFQPECATCSGGYVQLQCSDDDTLQILIEKLVDKFQLKNPSLETANDKLYMINELLPELKERSAANLERPLKEFTMKPRRPCPVCLKWTTSLYSHMMAAHNWSEDRISELKEEYRALRRERMLSKTIKSHDCGLCKSGYTCKIGLALRQTKMLKATDNEHSIFLDSKPLPSRPPLLPPLPEQLSVSEKGSVLCPVPRCSGRFTNHDSLAYHCMIEHSELGAAGTPQNFAIRQYRFETREEYTEWLYDRCEETCTSFSTKTSMWSGYAMYRCNRAGHFRTSGTIRIGCTSKKAQSHCSAFLRISAYTDGSVDVTCCFGHIFHELDPTALRLNERQTAVLQKLIEEGKSLVEIGAQMRAEYPPTNRLHYTTSNDIRNLALRLGLEINGKEKRQTRSQQALKEEGGGEEQDDEENEAEQSASSDSDIDDEDEEEDEDEEMGSEYGDYTEGVEHEVQLFPDVQDGEANEQDNRPSRNRRAPRRFDEYD